MGGQYWIKLYVEMLDDPKVAMLSNELFRRWIEVLLMAGLWNKKGELPPLPMMAWKLRTSSEMLESALVELAKSGLVSQVDGAWFVPNFAKRQEPLSNSERGQMWRKAARERQRLGSATPGERQRNVQRTNRSPDNRRQKKKTEDRSTEADAEGFGVVVTAWEAAAGPITPMVAEHLADLAGEAESHRRTLPAESAGALADGNTWVVEAIRAAAESATGPLSVAFVRAILTRWMREGLRSPRRGVRTGRSPVLDPDSEEARQRYVQGRFAEFIEH